VQEAVSIAKSRKASHRDNVPSQTVANLAVNVNDNVNVNVNDIFIKEKKPKPPKPKTYKTWTKEEFKEDIRKHSEGYSSATLNTFYNYWSELTPNGQMLFQRRESWETARRLLRFKTDPKTDSTKTETPKAPAPITPKFQQEQNEA
jgi:hypothetical protein